MKKIFLMFFILAIFMISCKLNKEPLSSEKFESIMKKNGFSIESVVTPQLQNSGIKEILIAKNDNYQIEFYTTDDSDKAIILFNINKEKFMLSKGNGTIETSKTIGNQSRYSLKANSKFKLLSRVENTLIYIDAPSEYEKSIKEILKNM